MDKVADTLLILEDDGSVSGYVGKCSEYIQYRELKAKEDAEKEKEAKALQQKKDASSGGSLQGGQVSDPSVTLQKKKKLSYKEQKEFEGLEGRIAELEERQKALEEDMASADFAKASAAGSQYKVVVDELEKAYERWEELASFA